MNDGQKARQNDSAGHNIPEYWQNWYETACKPLFNIPQFGLTRYYQEHTNQNLDKYCELQGTVAEFLDLLLQPVTQSFQESQKTLFESAIKSGETKELKDIYTSWLTTLEKQYMELFRSPDYTQCLNKTMQSFNEFVMSRQKVLEDGLKLLPIPTNSDMDGLYKEIYELKKRVREMEKEQVMH
jgi:polyhydroxyalkanoate synthase subunit PhaE